MLVNSPTADNHGLLQRCYLIYKNLKQKVGSHAGSALNPILSKLAEALAATSKNHEPQPGAAPLPPPPNHPEISEKPGMQGLGFEQAPDGLRPDFRREAF